MATHIRVFLEKHNGRATGGSWFRTRKGTLIGRGVAAKLFRGEECEVPQKMWEDANFRKDVYNALRLPGYQVVPRFEVLEMAEKPAPVTVTPIEANKPVIEPSQTAPKRPARRRAQFQAD